MYRQWFRLTKSLHRASPTASLTCCRTRPIQIITVIVCIDYFTVSFVFDGVNMSGDIYSADPFLYIILNGLVEVPGYSLTAPIVSRWGRKMPTVLSYVLSGIILAVVAFTPAGDTLYICLNKGFHYSDLKIVNQCTLWMSPSN